MYAERPNKLFTGAEVQLEILISKQVRQENIFATKYNKWESVFRDCLFECLYYTDSTSFIMDGSIPKIGGNIEINILKKLCTKNQTINHYKARRTNYFVSYRNAGGRYYKIVLNFEPKFKVNSKLQSSSTYQKIYVDDEVTRDALCATMNSTLFFWHWGLYSDTWHMLNREIGSFPLELSDGLKSELAAKTQRLMHDYIQNSRSRTENRNKGKDKVEFTQFTARSSKYFIDEIDKLLAKHYGFTEEELDFIINYDIKYRMGKELERA